MLGESLLEGPTRDSSAVSVENNRKTQDFSFSQTSSLYSRIILALNSFSDVVSSIYTFSFALAVLVIFHRTNGGNLEYVNLYNDDVELYMNGANIPDIPDGILTDNAKSFLTIWVFTEGINTAILICFRLYANLRFSKVTGDPTVHLRRLAVVKAASLLHYNLVLWSTAGFSATMASFDYMKKQNFATILDCTNDYDDVDHDDDYQGPHYNYCCRIIECTPAYFMSTDVKVITIFFLYALIVILVEYYFQPFSFPLGCNCIFFFLYLFIVYPFIMVSQFIMPFVKFLVQLLLKVMSVCFDNNELVVALEVYGLSISLISEACFAALGWRDLREPYASIPSQVKRQLFSIALLVAASLVALILGLANFCLSIRLFDSINPTTLLTACSPFTPAWLASFWIFSKLVQVAVSLLIPIVRLWFTGKLRRLRSLLYIFLVVDTLQLFIDHLFKCLRASAQRDAEVDLAKEEQEIKEKLAHLRDTLLTEISELSEILFDMQKG